MLALVLVVASCGGAPDAQTAPAKAVVDETRGTVARPMDAYLPTRAQRDEFAYALEIKASECAKAQGVSFAPIKREQEQAASEFGVWQMSYATKYGYGAAVDPTTKALNERADALSEADQNVVYGCMTRPDMGALKFPSSALTRLTFMRELSSTRPIDTPPGQKVLNEWRDCLKAADITPPGEPEKFQEYSWIPPDVAGMTVEARFQTAAADVKCKNQVHLVQREADIEAGMQQKVIAEHGPDLTGFRDLWQSHLAVAQKVIDGYHGA